jgi:hypothetical protein
MIITKENSLHYEIEEQKWALAIESIKSLTAFKKKKLTLKMLLDKTINKKVVESNKLKLKNKKEREFLFYYDEDMKNFIFQCRTLFYKIKKNCLPVNLS